MAKVRLYELVKELSASPKDLLTKLGELGVDASSPLASIDSEDADRLRKYVATGELVKRDTPIPVAQKPSYEPIVQRPTVVVRFESDKSKPAEPVKKPAKKKAPAAKAVTEATVVAPAKKATVKKPAVAKPETSNVTEPEKPTAYVNPSPSVNPAPPQTEPPTEKPSSTPEVKLTPSTPVIPAGAVSKDIPIMPAETPPIKPSEKKPENVSVSQQEKPPEIQPEKTIEIQKEDIAPIQKSKQEEAPAASAAQSGQSRSVSAPARAPQQHQVGDRPQRPMGSRPPGDRSQRDAQRPVGSRPPGDRPQRDTQRPVGSRPSGDRPQRDAQRPVGSRPPGDRPQRDGQRTFSGPRRDDKIGNMIPRPERTGDNKSKNDKSVEVRPRKRDGDKQRPSKEAETPKRKKTPGSGVAYDSDTRVRRRKTFDPKARKREPQMTATAAKKLRKLLQAQEEANSTEIKVLQIPKSIVITEFAQMMRISPADIVKDLFLKKNMMISQNADISFDVASEIALERGYLTEEIQEVDLLEKFFTENDEEDAEEDKTQRPPVVVVMGHVDHGKTSLLDAIRDTNVISGEAGGITQHIGAYTIEINNRVITFLDTPGHEAFTAMRMRGALITDIAVLVVAADDGVMPQTIEALNHAKAAGVEIIVAINKIDKPSANPDRVKQELTEHGILVEDWGGETISVPVSAKTREGLSSLLEMILLAADMKDLKANPNKSARGTVIEAALDKGRGPVATILVKDGTINIGDPLVAGGVYGKIRAMTDDKGNKVRHAGPSMPVEILGLSGAPQAGDSFFIAKSEREARQLSESVVAKGRQELLKETVQKVSLDALFDQIQQGAVKELNIVVKADVQGSVEAVKSSLEKLSNDEVRIRTIHGGVGAVTESDVMLASASNAIIIAFNVRPDAQAVAIAESEKVDMRLYRIIYKAIEDITAAMKGLLDPVYEEKVIGQAEIRQLFRASGIGTIGGCYVTSGKITRTAGVRIIRDGTVVYEGEPDALRRFKDDVKEVTAGYECGLTFSKFNDIKEGDIVESFIMEEIPR